MSSKHKDGIRGFYRINRSYWASEFTKSGPPEIIIGIYHFNKDGSLDGSMGEFSVKWRRIDGGVSPQINSWSALYQFIDLIKVMAEIDSQDIDENKFVDILKSQGIKDLTEYIKK